MSMCFRLTRTLAVVGALTLSSAGSVRADSTLTTDALTTMLTNMGYDVKSIGKDDITITTNSYLVEIQPSGDYTLLYFSINYGVPADKAPKTPMNQMLVYNGTHVYYYAIHQSNGLTDQSSFIGRLAAGAINPKSLRSLLDNITSEATAQQQTLNPDNWN